jgi:hypothetical protein
MVQVMTLLNCAKGYVISFILYTPALQQTKNLMNKLKHK